MRLRAERESCLEAWQRSAQPGPEGNGEPWKAFEHHSIPSDLCFRKPRDCGTKDGL